jgi:hypothetical protein
MSGQYLHSLACGLWSIKFPKLLLSLHWRDTLRKFLNTTEVAKPMFIFVSTAELSSANLRKRAAGMHFTFDLFEWHGAYLEWLLHDKHSKVKEIHYNYNPTFLHFLFSEILCPFCLAQMQIRMMFPIFYMFLDFMPSR